MRTLPSSTSQSDPTTSVDFLDLEAITTRVPVSKGTLRRAIRAGHLTAYKLGRSYLVKPVDLERWLESRQVNPMPETPVSLPPPVSIEQPQQPRVRLVDEVMRMRSRQ